MSTFSTTFRRSESATRATSRRDATTSTTTPTPTAEDASESITSQPQFSFLNFDSASPTPSATHIVADDPVSTTQISIPSATCVSDDDCGSEKTCSRGTCTSSLDAAPFGSDGSLGSGPTSKLSTGGAIGLAIGLIGLFALLLGLGFWLWKRTTRKPQGASIETPTTTRNRSASSATDQKTLVASLPNSPQNAGFRVQQEVSPAFFAKLAEANNPLSQNPTGALRQAHGRNDSTIQSSHERSSSNEKALPPPPSDMPLPPPPTEEKRYAINVNINKSMIFEDMSFASGRTTPARDSGLSREKMPKYRFEEYLPPVARTPSMSIAQPKSQRQTLDYEMEPYPRKLSDLETASSRSADSDDDQTALRRKNTLKKLESAPQLPPPTMPPPSPSFSLSSYFESYDWYQDIIGTEQPTHDDRASRTPTIPERNPARTPTQATFGATLSSNPPNATDTSLWPPPLSPLSPLSPPSLRASSFLHPSMAAQPSPTNSGFRLSPDVYQMPSKPESARRTRESLRKSSMTARTHASRSWLPDEGLYLSEEGTHDSYMMFRKDDWRRRGSNGDEDGRRVTSYTPL